MAQTRSTSKKTSKNTAGKNTARKNTAPKTTGTKAPVSTANVSKAPVSKAAVSKTTRATKSSAPKPSSTKSAKKTASVKTASAVEPTKSSVGKKPVTVKATPSEKRHRHDPALLALRAFGLSYPDAHLKSPWPEHLDLAVRDKTFAYLSLEGEALRMSCKLPQSSQAALDLEFTQPTEYGLGKSGWVTASFKDEDDPPVEFLKTWLDESYRAQAPKSLSKTLPKMT